jgi:phosphopantothenoylcysteine decarboxylase / phosphopantothenate---cysteine ligase
VVAHARAKLRRKGIPLIVANHGPGAFGRDDNALMVIDEHQVAETPRTDKLSLARALVAAIAQRLPKRST